jgi:hypothetical protein
MSKTELANKKSALKHHEAIIEDFQKSFRFAGASLRTIRDEGLYKDKFATFEEYCKSRWGFSRPRAYQLIDAVEVVEDLSTIVDTTSQDAKAVLPQNESQARALGSCADDAKQRHEVWSKVVEIAGDKPITAKMIEKVADEILPPKVDQPKRSQPTKTAETPVIPKDDSGSSDESNRDKRTVFNPEEFEPASTFDPEAIEGTKKPTVPNDKLKKTISDHAEQLGFDLTAARKSLEKLMNEVDAYHAHNQMDNHRSFTMNYQRLHKELTEAETTMIQVERAWKAGAK